MRDSEKDANRSWSLGLRARRKWFGAIRPRTPTVRCRSISRASRRPSSTGWTPLRKALAKTPSTRRSSRCSNCCSPMPRAAYPWPFRTIRGQPVLSGGRSGEWRNWQTRRIQVPVSARTWGFKSPLAHQPTTTTTYSHRPMFCRNPSVRCRCALSPTRDLAKGTTLSINEAQRPQVYADLERALGPESAAIVMEQVFAVDWRDLARQSAVDARFALVDAQFVALRGEMAELRAELKGEMAELRAEVRGRARHVA